MLFPFYLYCALEVALGTHQSQQQGFEPEVKRLLTGLQ